MPVPNLEPDQERRSPGLHLVTDDDIAAAVADGVTPLAPWHTRVSTVVSKLPGVFTERPASFAERVEYSRSGDWAHADEQWKRTAHLLAVLLTLPVGLFGALLLAATARPGRVLVIAVALWLLTHI